MKLAIVKNTISGQHRVTHLVDLDSHVRPSSFDGWYVMVESWVDKEDNLKVTEKEYQDSKAVNYYHHSRMDYQHGHLEKTNYRKTYIAVASDFFPSGETRSRVYINTYCKANGIDKDSLPVIEGATEFETLLG